VIASAPTGMSLDITKDKSSENTDMIPNASVNFKFLF
jgi:hypothetical protein